MGEKVQRQAVSNVLVFLHVSIICALCVLCYDATFGFDFAYDDFLHIPYSKIVSAPASEGLQLSTIFTTATYPGDLYRPLLTLSYRVTSLAVGMSPFYFHVTNVLLYIGVCCVAYAFLKMFHADNARLAFVSTALFAVHPLHSEVVANVSGRTELLAAFFLLLAFLSYLKSLADERLVFSLVAAFCFVLAVLSKESAYTLLALLVLHYGLFVPKSKRKFALKSIVIFACLALGLFAFRLQIVESPFAAEASLAVYHPENPLLHEPLFRRILPGIQYAGRALFLHFFPFHLQVDYSLPFKVFWQEVYSLEGLAFTVLSLAWLVLIMRFRRDRYAVFFLSWPILTGVFALNILTPIGTIMGERLVFLPSLGVIHAVVYILYSRLPIALWRKVEIAAVVLSVFIFFTVLRTIIWRDNLSVFRQAVRDNPKSPKAAMGLGMHYYHREKKPQLAEKAFKDAHRLDPSVTQAARYLIDISLAEKQYGAAEYWCTQVLNYAPGDKKVLEKLQVLQKARGITR